MSLDLRLAFRFAAAGLLLAALPVAAAEPKETNCTDRRDEDGDTVTDCADADCFADPACRPTGVPEATNSLCSDFIDNDGDGAMDCDDQDCITAGVPACKGSWQGGNVTAPAAAAADPEARAAAGVPAPPTDMPEAGQSLNVEEFIGKMGDSDGERTDELCGDGVDNDGDGKIDCADNGCRFDASVTVCTPTPGLRFSVVAQATGSYAFERANTNQPREDIRFSALQLRALGAIPGIQNSFFLVNARAERSLRLTFAMFQVPIGTGGHFFNVNSGGGGLTAELIRSIAKAPLVDPAFYMVSAFEQGNGAAVEFGGPVTKSGGVMYRTFLAGGAGRQNGNIGGRFFADDNRNFTWAVGAQFTINLIGRYNRFDTPFLYTPVPMTSALLLGAKFDQRAVERYPAGNAQFVFRYNRFMVWAETYYKYELEFRSHQVAGNVLAGVLLWPRHLFFAADFGGYHAGNLTNAPVDLSDLGSDVRRQRSEWMARAALHWYFWRNVGVISLMYRYRDVQQSRGDNPQPGFVESEARIVAQFRF